MIGKLEGTKNGYYFTEDTTEEDFARLVQRTRRTKRGLKCIICNAATSANFADSEKAPRITINKSVPDGAFYVNGKF